MDRRSVTYHYHQAFQAIQSILCCAYITIIIVISSTDFAKEAGHSIAGYDVTKNANSDANSTTTRSTKTQPMERSFE